MGTLAPLQCPHLLYLLRYFSRHCQISHTLSEFSVAISYTKFEDGGEIKIYVYNRARPSFVMIHEWVWSIREIKQSKSIIIISNLKESVGRLHYHTMALAIASCLVEMMTHYH